jgi:hypothetical protein
MGGEAATLSSRATECVAARHECKSGATPLSAANWLEVLPTNLRSRNVARILRKIGRHRVRNEKPFRCGTRSVRRAKKEPDEPVNMSCKPCEPRQAGLHNATCPASTA